jgi:magnesium transporter
MEYFEKQYSDPGTSPGSYQFAPASGMPGPEIFMMSYRQDKLTEEKIEHIESCQKYLTGDQITWVHIQGPINSALLEEIKTIFNVHALALEDIVNTGQRPKVHDFDDYLFVTLNDIIIANDSTLCNQISIIVGKNYIISHADIADNLFEPIQKRIRNKNGKHRIKGVDYLLYSLLDIVIDRGFPALEQLSDRIEDIEDDLLSQETALDPEPLHMLRRDLLFVKRMISPHREVIKALMDEESEHINESQFHFFRDCYDHSTHLIELVETYRETTAALMELYISLSSHKLNQIMRVLAVIATIFMPLTFIVGLYGMNFGMNQKSPWAMPELNWYYGYPLVWGIIIILFLGMIAYFKKKKWF